MSTSNERPLAADKPSSSDPDSGSRDDDSVIDLSGRTALSPIDSPSALMVALEESQWSRLAHLKAQPRSQSNQLALRTTYADLANYYEMVGGYEDAIRFLKNALSTGEDDDLRHHLARLQGRVSGFDFIGSFTELLDGRQYDLKMALEFCFFLEQKKLHTAALGVLESELAKRMKASLSNDGDLHDRRTIEGFLQLLQANISVDRQVQIQDYKEAFALGLPEHVFNTVRDDEGTPEQTIVGQTLEEFDENYGIAKLIQEALGLLAFSAKYYALPMVTVLGAIGLILLSVFRIASEIIEAAGSAFLLVLGALLSYDLLRSFRLTQPTRLREHLKVSRNISIISVSIIVLSWLGPKVFGGRHEHAFFSILSIKFVSLALVVSTLWMTFLSTRAIKRSLTNIRESIFNNLERTAFRRQVAGMVGATSGWALLLTLSASISAITQGDARIACYAALQAIFFICMWKWGSLEKKAERQRLRDELAIVSAVAISAMMAIEITMEIQPWIIVSSLSLNFSLCILVIACFLLQITSIRSRVISAFIAPFIFLNFSPVMERAGWFQFMDDFLAQLLPSTTLGVRVLVVLFLVISVPLLRRQRRISMTASTNTGDIYMTPKYVFNGGQFGAVGDNATASNFTQAGPGTAIAIDLKLLSDELRLLKAQLLALAKDPEHRRAIAEVAQAELSAKGDDREGALSSLRRAGEWVWDVATKVGIGVATAAAKQALGI